MTAAKHDIGDQLIALLPNMRRFALSLCRAPDVADDLVQQACMRALANAAGYQQGTRFDAWMFRIIRNLWIDHVRHARIAGPTEDVDESFGVVGTDGEAVAESRLMLASVSDAVDRLPADQREVLILTCVEDLSYREAADILGVPIGTVMSRLARARKKLAELAGIDAEPGRSPRRTDSIS